MFSAQCQWIVCRVLINEKASMRNTQHSDQDADSNRQERA
jgi:hypothetical protein